MKVLKFNTDRDRFTKFCAYKIATRSLLSIAMDVYELRVIETLLDRTHCFVRNNYICKPQRSLLERLFI